MNPLHGIRRWLALRPWRQFLYCLPALLALGMGLVVISMIFVHGRIDMHWRYQNLAKYYLATHQYEPARVACLRGLNGRNNSQERARWLYYLAIAMNGLGQQRDAAALINAAAPADSPGCVEAHLIVVENLLSSTNLTPEILKLAERHLLNALKLEPDSLEVNEDLARYYINTHELPKAQARLMKIYSRKPDTALLLAISYDMQTNAAAALSWADRALAAYEHNLMESAPNYHTADRIGLVRSVYLKQKYSQLQATAPPSPAAGAAPQSNVAPQDSQAVWLGIVRLLLSNGKFAPALQTLEQQMQVNSNAFYASALGDVCALWARQIVPDNPAAAATHFQLIQKGLGYDPENLDLKLLLVQTTHAKDDTAAPAQKLLDQLVKDATGTMAAWWQFVLWTDDRIRGDLASARQHLQSAYQLDPDIPQIKNDLAMDLSAGSPADQAQALKLIQSVLDQFPYEPGFRDTRGHVYAALGRYREALADLEFAVPREANATGTKKLLATVYTALGMTPPTPEVSSSKEIGQVVTLMNQREYAAAMKILEDELQAGSNSVYAPKLAEVCADWAESLPADQVEKRLQLIQKGLLAAPDNQKLQALLLPISHLAGPAGAGAKNLIARMVGQANGETAAQWHLFLGQDARQRGDLAAARQELLAAYQLAPQAPQIQINLASLLADGPPADLAQGLALIQPLLDQFPDSPEFRDIRGRIFARLGRNQEAAADLELAVGHLENPAATRQVLARVYDALGKTKQAQQLRRLSP